MIMRELSQKENDIIFSILKNHEFYFKNQIHNEFKNFHQYFLGFDQNDPNLFTKRYNLNSLFSFKDKKFDCIILQNPFNQIENYREIFVEINRIMKKNGILICIFNESNKITKPQKWQKLYLKKLTLTTGFSQIKISLVEKFKLWKAHHNTKNIVLFLKKFTDVKETYSKKCSKCGKPLGKNWTINEDNEAIHKNCPE